MRNRASRAVLTGLILLPALAIAGPARADTVTDWNATAAAALQSPGTAIPPGPARAPPSVHLAMVHGAVYDASTPFQALPLSRRCKRSQRFLAGPRSRQRPGAQGETPASRQRSCLGAPIRRPLAAELDEYEQRPARDGAKCPLLL